MGRHKRKKEKSHTGSPKEPLTKTEKMARQMEELSMSGSDRKDRKKQSGASTSQAQSEDESQDVEKPVLDMSGELTKREKRRAKQAKKAAAAENNSENVSSLSFGRPFGITKGEYQIQCNICQEVFSSRTKLFSHINSTGHALADSNDDRQKGSKKGKAGKR
jgi:DnaJ homolog subfamily A member 5